MDKELIDRTWACLPREFKEEVKRDYKATTDSPKWDEAYNCALEETFGRHNLTSDVEGEEMLTVPRKRVMEIYNHCNGSGAQAIEDIFGKLTYDMDNDGIITPLDKFKGLPHLNGKQEVITDYEGYAPTLYPYEGEWFVSWISSEGDSILDFQAESPETAIELAYSHLFGSKCLPDELNEDNLTKSESKKKSVSEISEEISDRVAKIIKAEFDKIEPKPAKPAFKAGDIVLCGRNKCKITDCFTEPHYYLTYAGGKYRGQLLGLYRESDLEPYAESEENVKMKPIESRVCVYLATKEEDEEFRTLLHKNGFMWNDGQALTSLSNWDSDHKSYQIHFVHPDKTVTFLGNARRKPLHSLSSRSDTLARMSKYQKNPQIAINSSTPSSKTVSATSAD